MPGSVASGTPCITKYFNWHKYCNFSEAQTLGSPDDGLVKPKHVGAFIVYLNVNFNILKQFNCALVGLIKDLITSKCKVQLWKLVWGVTPLYFGIVSCEVILEVVEFNPLNPELNPICYLLALLAHHFLHVSRIRVESLTIRLQMSYIYIYTYIYGAPILDVSRSHTTTQHSR